jgi:ribosomal protein S18 acetylase RimI-like enzyme
MVKSKELKIMRKKMEKADRFHAFETVFGKESKTTMEIEIVAPAASEETTKDNDNDKESYAPENDSSKGENNDIIRSNVFNVEFSQSSDLTDEKLKECLEVFANNMGDLYRESSWGLNLIEKAEELQHRKARFLIVTPLRKNGNEVPADDNNTNDDLAAFVHFRFCLDDDDYPSAVVLYVYEIQVREAYRRQGLGAKLMDLMEQIVRATEMEKVMLTVFKKNQSAMQFYTQKLNYEIDATSPSQHNQHEEYEILSKTP